MKLQISLFFDDKHKNHNHSFRGATVKAAKRKRQTSKIKVVAGGQILRIFLRILRKNVEVFLKVHLMEDWIPEFQEDW